MDCGVKSMFIFSLSKAFPDETKSAIEEAFIISTVTLVLLIAGLYTLKVFNLIPLILYIYIYIVVYEINNNFY